VTSPLFCDHANENPVVCTCASDCYCYEHTCSWRKKRVTVKSPIENMTVIRSPRDVPTEPHFAVMVYDSDVTHYVTENQEHLETFVKALDDEGHLFVFFAVSKLGKLVTVKTQTVSL